jgi:hypothetical protein
MGNILPACILSASVDSNISLIKIEFGAGIPSYPPLTGQLEKVNYYPDSTFHS